MSGVTKPATRGGVRLFSPAYVDHDDKKQYARSGRSGSKQWLLLGLIACIMLFIYQSSSQKHSLNNKSLCQRSLSLDLSNPKTWPTPYTPSYFESEPVDSQKVVLLTADGAFGDEAMSINGLFHALDVAYDKKCPLYITHDATWVWKPIMSILYGKTPARMEEQDWKLLGDILGVTVVSSQVILSGKDVERIHPQGAFYVRSDSLDKIRTRNRRDTIWRKIFHYSGTLTPKSSFQSDTQKPNQCDLIQTIAKSQKSRPSRVRYSVIDSIFNDNSWLPRLQENMGRDLHDAAEISPDYVKGILGPLNLLQSPIYIMGGGDKSNERIQRLLSDPTLKGVIQEPSTVKEINGREIHLAVMADAYLGNPVSHRCLLIAKMRYALGKGNTFVVTKKSGDTWVDGLGGRYEELYDKNVMGLWMG